MKILACVIAACLCSALAGRSIQAMPAVTVLTSNHERVKPLDKFELTFQLTGTGYKNPFDPDQITVSAIFTSPKAKHIFSVDGFSYQGFSRSGPPEKLIPEGKLVWKVRFSPVQTGVWTYSLKIVDRKTGTVILSPRHFTCAGQATSRGFVHPSARNRRYLEYNDGSAFIPIGQNLGWGNWGMNNGTFSYDTWLPKIAAQGGNFARYWMWADFHGIEWNETGLGDYTKRMNEAWRLDHDVEAARDHHIQVMLTLLDHGTVSTKVNPTWRANPYNAANGGPCATPRDFFAQPAAKAFFRRRLRYIVARWGYSANLMWEIANEIDNTDDYLTNAGVRNDVAEWHREMAGYLKARDARRHLVTTSFSRFQNDAAIWAIPAVDLTQFHFYSTSPAMEAVHAAVIARYRTRFPAKPVLGGEIGFPGGGPFSVANDPTGIHWHNAQWASLLSGAAGASALWWWADYIEPQDLYMQYRGLSKFAAALDWLGAGLVPTHPAVTTKTTSGTGRAGLLLTGYPEWGFKAEANQFAISPSGSVSPGEDALASYIYSKADNVERYNPPSFQVNFHAAGEIRLLTGSPNGKPHLVVSLDGRMVYEGNPDKGSTVVVSVGAGPHRISVDNTGTGWVEVTNYEFTNLVPVLHAYVLQGPKAVAGWVMNRNFNYALVKSQGMPPAVSGTIHLRDLTNHGLWKVEWWDTRTGVISNHTLVSVRGKTLDLTIPATRRDVAFQMRFLGVKRRVMPH